MCQVNGGCGQRVAVSDNPPAHRVGVGGHRGDLGEQLADEKRVARVVLDEQHPLGRVGASHAADLLPHAVRQGSVEPGVGLP